MLLGLGGVAPPAAVHGQCRYSVEIIQAPGCTNGEEAPTIGIGLDDEGNVVGYYIPCPDGEDQAFIRRPSGEFITITDAPGVTEGRASGASGGAAVGRMLAPAYDRGFLWRDSVLMSFEPSGGGYRNGAFAIHDGAVVGYRDIGLSDRRAFIWRDGEFTHTRPAPGMSAYARGIFGDSVVGWIGNTQSTDARPFLWQGGVLTDLGLPPGAYSATANDINSKGTIALSAWRPDPDGSGFVIHGVLWKEGRFMELGVLPGFQRSQGLSINSAEQVVGTCSHPNPNIRQAFLWQSGRMHDLDALLMPETDLHLYSGSAINQQGWIVCAASRNQGAYAALLRPVAQPPTDLTNDCLTGRDDLMVFLEEWGKTKSRADFNGDGVVNVTDLLELLANWG